MPRELTRPIPRPSGPVTQAFLAREWINRFRILLRHYGIEESAPDKWASLLLRLALDYIPGFRLRKANKGGRPRKRAIRISKRARQAKTRRKFYDDILLAHLIGAVRLQEKGIRVTGRSAIEEGIGFLPALFGNPTSGQIKQTAVDWAKRLAVAEKFVQKSSET